MFLLDNNIPTLILAAVIFIDDPHGSPFFAQERVGKDGKFFRFYKLRSMTLFTCTLGGQTRMTIRCTLVESDVKA